jgi:hypothetical protein
MRIDARSWGNENRKLDIATTFEGFQVWKDRALMFLSRERPDIRRLLSWAEGQTKEGLEANLAAQAAQFGVGRVRHPRWHQADHPRQLVGPRPELPRARVRALAVAHR